MKKTLEFMENTSLASLCHGIPKEFLTYLTYTRSLSFSDKPDY